jgi:hypothetical protein
MVAGLSVAKLLYRDSALKLVTAKAVGANGYCISAQWGSWWASKAGPAADIVPVKQATDPCP